MALIERTAYPRFSPRPSAGELARLYTPTLLELDLARRATRGGQAQQLAFLVMLKGFQRLGYFPKTAEVPGAVVDHLRSRLGLAEEVSASPPARSRQRYRDAIRAHLGVEAFGDDARRVAAEAVAGAALAMDEPAVLVNVAVEELVKERFGLPAFSTLDRLTRKVRHAANARLFSRVDGGLSEAGRARLDALLEADAGGRSDLGVLKAPPKSATRKNLSELRESLLWMESLGDTRLLLSGIPNQKVAHLAAQTRALDASELKKVGPERRRAMLVCLIQRAKVSRRDGLAEILVKTVGKAHARAKQKLDDLHRERRAATEVLVGVLEQILVGAQNAVPTTPTSADSCVRCSPKGTAPRRSSPRPSPSLPTEAATTCRFCGASTRASGRRSSGWPARSSSDPPPRTAPSWAPCASCWRTTAWGAGASSWVANWTSPSQARGGGSSL